MPMYPNLAAEMSRNGITAEKMAKQIGINAATMSAKINKKDRMKLCEAARIRDSFFPEMSIDYLFSTELVERSKAESAQGGETICRALRQDYGQRAEG